MPRWTSTFFLCLPVLGLTQSCAFDRALSSPTPTGERRLAGTPSHEYTGTMTASSQGLVFGLRQVDHVAEIETSQRVWEGEYSLGVDFLELFLFPMFPFVAIPFEAFGDEHSRLYEKEDHPWLSLGRDWIVMALPGAVSSLTGDHGLVTKKAWEPVRDGEEVVSVFDASADDAERLTGRAPTVILSASRGSLLTGPAGEDLPDLDALLLRRPSVVRPLFGDTMRIQNTSSAVWEWVLTTSQTAAIEEQVALWEIDAGYDLAALVRLDRAQSLVRTNSRTDLVARLLAKLGPAADIWLEERPERRGEVLEALRRSVGDHSQVASAEGEMLARLALPEIEAILASDDPPLTADLWALFNFARFGAAVHLPEAYDRLRPDVATLLAETVEQDLKWAEIDDAELHVAMLAPWDSVAAGDLKEVVGVYRAKQKRELAAREAEAAAIQARRDEALAYALMACGDADGALLAAAGLRERASADGGAVVRLLGRAHRAAGLRALGAGNRAVAAEHFEQAMTSDPGLRQLCDEALVMAERRAEKVGVAAVPDDDAAPRLVSAQSPFKKEDLYSASSLRRHWVSEFDKSVLVLGDDGFGRSIRLESLSGGGDLLVIAPLRWFIVGDAGTMDLQSAGAPVLVGSVAAVRPLAAPTRLQIAWADTSRNVLQVGGERFRAVEQAEADARWEEMLGALALEEQAAIGRDHPSPMTLDEWP